MMHCSLPQFRVAAVRLELDVVVASVASLRSEEAETPISECGQRAQRDAAKRVER